MQQVLADDQPTRAAGVLSVHDELVRLVRQLVSEDRFTAGVPTFAQHSLLTYVSKNPGCRATQISGIFGVHRSTVSRQLRACIDEGWVHVEPGPLRSGHPLTLTSAGTAALASATEHRVHQVEARVVAWSEDEIGAFAHDLRRFRELGDENTQNKTSVEDRNGNDRRA